MFVDPVVLKKRREENPRLFDELYRFLFNSCFRFDPKMRPSFNELFSI